MNHARQKWTAFAALFSLGGCGVAMADIAGDDTCPNPDIGFIDPATGLPDPCHEHTPWPDACAGECVPIPPQGRGAWAPYPMLMWFGPKGAGPPECPDTAPSVSFQGYTDLDVPPLCDECTCEPSVGSCGIAPDMKIRAHAATCPGTGATETSFDPPASWNGSCTAMTQIPEKYPCPEGVCAQSITLDPLVIENEACAAGATPTPTKPTPPEFLTEVWGCGGADRGECKSRGEFCAFPTPGFRLCVFSLQDVACPTDTYTDRYVLYDGVEDHRSCECSCGTPVGSACTGCIATYGDDTCSVMHECIGVSSIGSACKDIQPPGAALLSKQALNMQYHPGTCEPHGTITGDIELLGPATMCCRPPTP